MQDKPDQKSFIREVMIMTGWTQTDLAKRAGLNPSTLSRFLSNRNDGQELRESTLRRIEQLVGKSYAGRSNGVTVEQAPQFDGFGEAEQLALEGTSNNLTSIIAAQLSVGGKPVDAWILKSRSLELAGYRPGDTMFVGLGETALKGDVVCAQIYDWQQRRAQTVFRIFDPPFLVAATTDTSLLKPYEIQGDSVAIKGVVLHCLRSRS